MVVCCNLVAYKGASGFVKMITHIFVRVNRERVVYYLLHLILAIRPRRYCILFATKKGSLSLGTTRLFLERVRALSLHDK